MQNKLAIRHITLLLLAHTCMILGQAPVPSSADVLKIAEQLDQKFPASKLPLIADSERQSILDKVSISRDIQPIIWGYLDTWHFYKTCKTGTTHANAFVCLFSPDEQQLVLCDSRRAEYTIAQVKTDAMVYKNQPQPISDVENSFSMSFRPTGDLLVTARDYYSTDGYTVPLFDAVTKHRYMVWDVQYLIKTNSVAIYHFAVSPDGKLIATTEFTRIFKSRDCMYFKYIIKIWEIATQKLLYTLRPTCDLSIRRILFSPDSKSLALLGVSFCTIEYFTWNFEKNIFTENSEFTKIKDIEIKNAFFISPQKKLVISCNHGYVTIIDLDKDSSTRLIVPDKEITACAAAADNKIAAALLGKNGKGVSICIWQDNLKDYKEIYADKISTERVTALTCSPRGTYIAAASSISPRGVYIAEPPANLVTSILLLKNQGGEIRNTSVSELEKLSAARAEKSGCCVS